MILYICIVWECGYSIMETKNNLVRRMSKIKGQVDGVEKMIVQDRDCLDVVQQIVAVRSALSGVAKELIKDNVSSCKGKSDEFERLVNSLFNLI